MGIRLSKVRISEFRSIKECEIALDNMTLLIGANGAGKTNILKAINIALNANPIVSKSDIRLEKDGELDYAKVPKIDVLFEPIDKDGNVCKEFSAFWVSTFSINWISVNSKGESFVGIRTTVEYDKNTNQYKIKKFPIKEWGESVESARVDSKSSPYTQDMRTFISCYYVDAHRDIVEDIRSTKSYFGRATSAQGMDRQAIKNVEDKLNEINEVIVGSVPMIENTSKYLSSVIGVTGSGNSLSIEPVSSNIDDLRRGMDILLTDEGCAKMSVSEYGMGTRSWASLLALGAYITNQIERMRSINSDAEFFSILTLEEPESHLHVHAQKRLFSQITGFCGQKIVSTHSSNIVAQTPIKSLICCRKINGKTECYSMSKSAYYTPDSLGVFGREILRSRGELLFSTAVILAEGITEELALPLFFNKYFGEAPHSMGVSIIGVGGVRYKEYLQLLKDFNIPCFIFSDSEDSTKSTVNKAVKDIYGENSDFLKHIVFLSGAETYESNLIELGYADEIKKAINKYELKIRKIVDPEGLDKDPREFFDRFVEEHNKTKKKHKDTGEICPKCKQHLIEDVLYEYDGPNGEKEALKDIARKGKAKYAEPVALEIIESGKELPADVVKLFKLLRSIIFDKKGSVDD